MFYLDNSDISFSGDVATLPGYYYSTTRKTVAPTVTGSPTHDLFLQMNAGLKPLTDTLSAVNERYLNEYYVPELEGKEVDESVGKALVREERKWNDRLLQAKLDLSRAMPAQLWHWIRRLCCFPIRTCRLLPHRWMNCWAGLSLTGRYIGMGTAGKNGCIGAMDGHR